MAQKRKEPVDLTGMPYQGALHQGSVALAANKTRLTLEVGLGVFSAAFVDVGTQLLLRTLVDVPGERIFDLGCGYGPIGLLLAARRPGSRTVLMDRDAVAVAYAAHNAKSNGVEGVEVVAGLGWADLPPGFEPDLTASNIPAKAGPEVIRHLLIGGPRPEGALRAVVVIERLGPDVELMLEEAGAEVHLRKENRAHLALHYSLPAGPELDDSKGGAGLALHHRDRPTFSAGKLDWELDTAWGLPEFDTLTHSTKLAVKVLREVHRRPDMDTMVLNPGVGHLPLAVSRLIGPASLHLAGRDLLALRHSQANLQAEEGLESVLHHSPLPEVEPESIDLCITNLTEKLTSSAVTALVHRLSAMLRPAGRLIVAGTSTAVYRVTAAAHTAKLPLIALDQRKDMAHSAADFVRT